MDWLDNVCASGIEALGFNPRNQDVPLGLYNAVRDPAFQRLVWESLLDGKPSAALTVEMMLMSV